MGSGYNILKYGTFTYRFFEGEGIWESTKVFLIFQESFPGHKMLDIKPVTYFFDPPLMEAVRPHVRAALPVKEHP